MLPFLFLDFVILDLYPAVICQPPSSLKIEYDCIAKDDIVLWIVVDHDKDDDIIAAITTKLIEYPQGRSMAMDWIGGTRMKEWLPMTQEVISRYAKDHNCKYLEGYGRKGWGRWLGKYGWKPDYIAYKMELS